MPEVWTGYLIGEMHNAQVKLYELAEELGVSKAYVSMVLNGQRNPKDARERFNTAFRNIVARKGA